MTYKELKEMAKRVQELLPPHIKVGANFNVEDDGVSLLFSRMTSASCVISESEFHGLSNAQLLERIAPTLELLDQ